MLSDADLIRNLGLHTRRHAENCREICRPRDNDADVPRSNLAKAYGVQNLRLVNSTHILTLAVECEDGINCVQKLYSYLQISCISPKMASKIFFKLNGFTLSVSLKMSYPLSINGRSKALQIVGANLAGCCSIETVISLGWELSRLFERSSRHLRVVRLGYQLVNNVIILDAGGNALDVEKLVEQKMDRLKTYNPEKFPGATFVVNKFGDCRIMIAFTTAIFSFLGSLHPSVFYHTLRERLPVIKRCQTNEKIDLDPKIRHRKRISINHEKQNEGLSAKRKRPLTENHDEAGRAAKRQQQKEGERPVPPVAIASPAPKTHKLDPSNWIGTFINEVD